jgi:hypothetical protein
MKKSLLMSACFAIFALSGCTNTKTPENNGTNPTPTNPTQNQNTPTPINTGTKSPSRPENSLCNANEKVIFNCKMEKDNNTLSVCASNNLNDSNSYVQYRYGVDKYNVGMRFPKDLSVSKRAFQLSSQGLGFKNGSIRYQLYTQGDSAGVKTFWATAPNRNKTLPCRGTITNQLDLLNSVLN